MFEALFEVGAVFLLEHFEVALQFLDAIIEVGIGLERIEGVGEGGEGGRFGGYSLDGCCWIALGISNN
jgi:hypothetical protein